MSKLHKTKEIEITIEVDERLADVVNMMNELLGVQTIGSCEGGYLKEHISKTAYMKNVYSQGYVSFYCTNRKSLIAINNAFNGANAEMGWGRSTTIEQTWQVDDGNKISYTVTWIPHKGKLQRDLFKHLKRRFKKAIKKVKK